jgi:hypothetical protein
METRGGAEMPLLRAPRYSPPVRVIKLTEQRELSPYVSVHPDEER